MHYIWQSDRLSPAPVPPQADQCLAEAACCPRDKGRVEGWTEDLRGRIGHHPPPFLPVSRVECTKCLLLGSNRQLFDI
ncbi:hypothetical protein AMECASPLE_003299 [Ameca splendens]|uniref:Uncharacterized protein n=1 Tax=Ameca splendens TaxID=208324 RepID=A0ABV0Z914_9TELE